MDHLLKIQFIQSQNEVSRQDLKAMIRYVMKYGYPESFEKYLMETNEILMKRTLKLDAIKCGSDEELRAKRKKEIRNIQRMHNIIDKLLADQ